MQRYYPNLQAIRQQTVQLDNTPCGHCQQTHHLVSHGFIRKKQVGAEPQEVGKRVYCSNRHRRTGCGRTMQLYIDSTIRYLHHAGRCVVVFVLSLMADMTIQRAYQTATGTTTPRNAYRWLHFLHMQASVYRSLQHRPTLQDPGPIIAVHRTARLALLMSTFQIVLQRFGQPLCTAYQSQLQRSFL